jgi:hypothetical protein
MAEGRARLLRGGLVVAVVATLLVAVGWSRGARADGGDSGELSFLVQRDGTVYTVRIDLLFAARATPAEQHDAVERLAAGFPGTRIGETEGGAEAAFVPSPQSWASHSAPYAYNAAGRPAALSGEAEVISAAAGMWATAGADFRFESTGQTDAGTGACHGSPDGADTIGWAGHEGAVLAVTCSWYAAGKATEFDMEIDPDWEWTTGTSRIGIDLQSVVTHELGHALGLSHSPDSGAVMFATYGAGTLKRALAPDDIAGIEALYGQSGVAPAAKAAELPAISIGPGANLVTWAGGSRAPGAAFGSRNMIEAVYTYDAATRTWLRYVPGIGDYANTLKELRPGAAYWVIATGAALIPVAP